MSSSNLYPFAKVGVCVDTRLIKKGELFFALKGERTDGHDHIEEAAKKGASAAVVSKDYKGSDFGIPLIRAEDPLATLQSFAKEIMGKKKMRIIGVTGSVGKTTTKEFLATLLEGKFKVAKSPGNSNSQIGVPLTIVNECKDEELLVMEMGMSAPHEIEKLIDIAPPEMALITKISLAHSEFFPDGLTSIAQAKGEIFTHPKTRLGIYNIADSKFEGVSKRGGCKKLTFGLDGDADYKLHERKEGLVIQEGDDFSPVFTLPFQASHFRENFLGAVAVARSLGMKWEEIFAQTKHLKSYKRRFERVEKDGVVYINDSYNASPESMRAAITNLPDGIRKIAVLGSMKELGHFSKDAHLEIGKLALKNVDYLLCLGNECAPMVDVFAQEKRPVEFFTDIESMSKSLKKLVKPGDVVLLKGSNSMGLWRLLEEKI